MVVKFVALVVLIFAVKSDANEETKNSLDRNCENSEPFLIKNEKKRKAYLTADVRTGAVNGAKKNGDANQQWMWNTCEDATYLVNVATGGCLTLEAEVSDECDIVWEHGDNGVVAGTGTLSGFSLTDGTSGFGRLMKRSAGLRIVQEVNLKVGTSIIQDWFLWGIESV